MNLNQLSLKAAVDKLNKKEISITDLYKDVFVQIENKNQELNVFLSLNKNASAKAVSKQVLTLKGIPIAVKDNFLTTNLNTTAASKLLKNYRPVYDSTATKKIRNAGAVIIGKTNMDAWAHGSSTETSDFGTTKNPRNPNFSPGGSSGGSAAAVAADMCMAAIGSETAGSIRLPASWCGIVGLKPTYGRVSRYGVIAMGSSLDCPGPMTKTVEDAAILFDVIAGYDHLDATTSPKSVVKLSSKLKEGVRNMRIGVCYTDHKDLKGTIAAKSVISAAKVLEQLGAKTDLVKVSNTPSTDKILAHDFAIGMYTVLQRSEVSSNLARYDGIRYGQSRSYFGQEAKNRILLGTFTLSAGYHDKYYIKAQKVRSLYIQNYRDLFKKYDVLISPTTPGYAEQIGASENNPLFGELMDMLVEASSIAGLPGISIPCFHDRNTNLYLGLNIIADQWQEEKIIRAAYAYEQSTAWNPWLSDIE